MGYLEFRSGIFGRMENAPGNPVVSISERLRLSSGHHAYGSAARPLRPQIKDGVMRKFAVAQSFLYYLEKFLKNQQ